MIPKWFLSTSLAETGITSENKTVARCQLKNRWRHAAESYAWITSEHLRLLHWLFSHSSTLNKHKKYNIFSCILRWKQLACLLMLCFAIGKMSVTEPKYWNGNHLADQLVLKALHVKLCINTFINLSLNICCFFHLRLQSADARRVGGRRAGEPARGHPSLCQWSEKGLAWARHSGPAHPPGAQTVSLIA